MTLDEKKACLAIKHYLNNPNFTLEFIFTEYEYVVDMIIQKSKNNQSHEGIKSMSEGNQSVTYDTNYTGYGVTDDIKALLPRPYMGMW